MATNGNSNSYFTITNNTFANNGNNYIGARSNGAEKNYYITFSNNTTTDSNLTGWNGILWYDDVLLNGDAHGIGLQNINDSIVSDNFFSGGSHEGAMVFWTQTGSESDNVQILRNRFQDIQGSGLTLGSTVTNESTGNIAAYNVFDSVGLAPEWNSGIYLTGNQSPSNYILNNSFFGTDIPIKFSTDADNWIVKNNISQDPTVYHAQIASTGILSNILNYNNYSPTASIAWIINITEYIFSQWQTASGQDSNSLNNESLFIDGNNGNFNLNYLSTNIDAGTSSVSPTSTDAAGNPIYGVPDIGAYEFQPPYTFSADGIPLTGSVRLYSDGQYRVLTATSTSATGTFSVAPVDGYITASTSQFMDITIDSWLTTGTKNKQWTATSSAGSFQTHATSTTYTIGNLATSTYYQFNLDGAASTSTITGNTCTNGLCLSDSSGNLTFTYTGGYSTHTFSLEQDTNAPTNIGISSITADSTSQLTIVAQTATDSDPGLHSTPYWFNETSDNSGASDSTEWQTSTSFIDSDLSSNTQYTYQVKARDGNSNESAFSTATSTYTLAPTPTNLAGTAGQTTVDLSVDSFTNDTADSSGYYFYRSGANSGWIQTNSWSDSGLACGNSYTYSVIYRNGDGVETDPISLTIITIPCSGIPPEWNNPPKIEENAYSVLINDDAKVTSVPTVILILKGGSNISKMAISNFPDFRDASQEKYNPTKVWNLCWTDSILQTPLDCPVGTYTVYVKYYTSWGKSSEVITDTIIYKTGNIVTPDTKPDTAPDTTDNRAIDNSNTAQTNTILNSTILQFTRTLRFGQISADVKQLQIFLNKNPDTQLAKTGVGSPGKETNIFGYLTRAAVIKFQEKYTSEILAPLGIKKGTGLVGDNTRTKLNKILGFDF